MDWIAGLGLWTGLLDWDCGLDCGLDCRTGLMDWIAGETLPNLLFIRCTKLNHVHSLVIVT